MRLVIGVAASPLPAGEWSDRAYAIRVRGEPDSRGPSPAKCEKRAHSDLCPTGRDGARCLNLIKISSNS
jgi:hypothetical protein